LSLAYTTTILEIRKEINTLNLKVTVLNEMEDYAPLPSLALTRSSLDLHLLHLAALGAFDAPHFMHIFLFNNRSSASGNLAI
jgi:hypothetical protein